MIYMKKFYFLFVLLFSFFPIYSQPGQGNYQGPKNGKITGKVKESVTDKFVEYATISVYSQKDSSLVTGTITLPDGSFTLSELPFGMFYVEATFVGYEKTRLTKILLTPQKLAVDVGILSIIPSSTALEAVEITAERPQIEYKIDKKIISVDQNIASSGGTAVDVLENTPSVQVDIEGNVSLRGSENFIVLIDGKPSILKGSEALQQLPASIIQNIEIITNPSAKFDADGSAGIINIIMKKQKQAGINGIVNANASTNGSYGGDFLFNLRKNNFNYTLGAEYNKRSFQGEGNFYKEIIGDSTFYQEQSGEREFRRNRNGIRGGIEYSIDSKKSISISGEVDEGNFGRPQTSRNHFYYNTGYDTYFISRNDDGVKRFSYELKSDYIQKFDDNGHQIIASFQYSDQNSDDIEERKEDNYADITYSDIIKTYWEKTTVEEKETDIRGKIDYTWPISEKSRFEAGYQYRLESSSSDYIIDTARTVVLGIEPVYKTKPNSHNEKTFHDEIHSIYSTYSTSLGKIVDVQAGLRIEYNNRILDQLTLGEEYKFNKLDFFPSIHISKKLPKDYQLQASYTRRTSRPNDRFLDPFRQYENDTLNIRVGNPELKPEYTNSYELNAQKNLKGVGFLSIEAFHRQTVNRFDWIMTVDSNLTTRMPINMNSDFSTGGEFMVNLPMSKWFILNASASVFDYRIQNDYTGKKQTISWNARFSGMFRFKWGMQAQLTGFYNGPSITTQGTRKGVFFSNIGIRQDFLKKQLTVSLQMRDLFGSSKFKMESSGVNFYSRNEMQRQAQVFSVSVSYKINNYKQKNRMINGEEGVNESEFDGGGEMF